MGAETPILETPKFRRYISPAGEFYLATEVVTENGNPKVSVSRWAADSVFREMEARYSAPEGSIQSRTLYDSHFAASQDEDMRESILDFPAEMQSTLY